MLMATVDWEYPSDAQQGKDYIFLLSALRTFLSIPKYILTSALPAGVWALRHIDIGLASTYLDSINLMAYDFAGPWTDKSGHHAQLFTPPQPHSDAASISCDSAVKYLCSKGVPARMINLGIPVYGRSFLGATNINQNYTGQAGDEGTFEYRYLPRRGASEYVDGVVGAAYCAGGDGGFVTYDNPQTVQMKANYVREHQLGGLFYWHGTADATGRRSLVSAGSNALRGS